MKRPWRKPGRRHVKMRGISPLRNLPADPWIEVTCVDCGAVFETVAEQDGEPVNVVSCGACGAVQNRATGEVLARQPAKE